MKKYCGINVDALPVAPNLQAVLASGAAAAVPTVEVNKQLLEGCRNRANVSAGPISRVAYLDRDKLDLGAVGERDH
jgi:hypothetical protein